MSNELEELGSRTAGAWNFFHSRSTYCDDELLVKWACKWLSELEPELADDVSAEQAQQRNLAIDLQADVYVLATLEHYSENETIVEYCLICLLHFSRDPKICDQVYKKGAVKVMLNAMDKVMESNACQGLACSALYNICMDVKQAPAEALDLGAVEQILQAMDKFRDDECLQEKALDALEVISEGVSNPRKYDVAAKHGAGHELIRMLDTHQEYPSVISKVLVVIACLSTSVRIRIHFYELAVGNSILRCMNANRNQKGVLISAFEALSALAASYPLHKQHFVELGIDEVTFRAMKAFENCGALQSSAAALMKTLALFRPNKYILMQAGIATRIVIAMDKYLHTVAVQEQGCGALFALAIEDRNKEELMDSLDVPRKVIRAMDLHTDQVRLQENACGTLKALAADMECERFLMRIGAGERIIRAMKLSFSDQHLQKQTCGALINLSFDPDNQISLFRMGAGRLVLEAMRAHPDSATIQERGCAVVWNLATNHANKLSFLNLGALHLVRLAQIKFPDDALVTKHSKNAIARLIL